MLMTPKKQLVAELPLAPNAVRRNKAKTVAQRMFWENMISELQTITMANNSPMTLMFIGKLHIMVTYMQPKTASC